MIKDKNFKLGTLRFTMHIIKNKDENKSDFKNYIQTYIDILNPVSNEEGQKFINELEPGDYEIIIPLDNEYFNKKEVIEGFVIEDDKNES